jgi:T-complex protein 1 subunit theta
MLKMAEDLIRQGLHTSEIVNGYLRAYEKTLEILPTLVCKTITDVRERDQLFAGIKSVISTKQYGFEDLLSNLVCDAAVTTMNGSGGRARFNPDSLRIAKIRGGSVNQCTYVKGMVVSRDAEGVVKSVTKAKVAVFGCGVEQAEMEAKGTILLKNATDLLNYNKSEEKSMEDIISAIAATGVKLVISHGAVSELALHFLDKFGIMCVKIMSKFELRRICGALGATAVIRLGPPTPEELGEVSSVEVVEIAGRKVVKFIQDLNEDTTVATVIVRAATENVANDVERALDDAIHSVTALTRDGRLLPGAGAVELEVSKQLKAYADEVKGLDQYGIRKFADSFDVVPRTLAENSGQDPSTSMHQLHASHEGPNTANMGFDIDECVARDSLKAGVFDIYISKVNALRLAVDAAITVLKVDQIVMSKPAGGPKPPPQGGRGA